MVSLYFEISGYIVPYVRMTRKGKFVNPRALRYMASQDQIAWRYKEVMREEGWFMFPTQTPLGMDVHLEVARAMHKTDADNIFKALSDSAQGVVFSNDSWIDKISMERKQTGRDYARVRIYELDKEGE